MPPMASSTVRAPATVPAWRVPGSGELIGRGQPVVAGLVQGGSDLLLAQRGDAGHGHPRGGAGVQVDGHVLDAVQGAELARHRGHAVLAGHAVDAVGGGGAHRSLLGSCGLGMGVYYERTSRAMASEASRSFASRSGPPAATASTTQCSRCSSSSPRATACSALVAADT